MAQVDLAGQIDARGKAKQATKATVEAVATPAAQAFVMVDGERVAFDPTEPYGQERAVARFLTEHKGTKPVEYLIERCKLCGVSPIVRQGGGKEGVTCGVCGKVIEVGA